MRAVGHARVQAADKACFHYLSRVVSTKPLSAHAQSRAIRVLEQVRSCAAGYGVTLGTAVVTVMSRGRAMFGFQPTASSSRPSEKVSRFELLCERRVKLASKLDRIIAADRIGIEL